MLANCLVIVISVINVNRIKKLRNDPSFADKYYHVQDIKVAISRGWSLAKGVPRRANEDGSKGRSNSLGGMWGRRLLNLSSLLSWRHWKSLYLETTKRNTPPPPLPAAAAAVVVRSRSAARVRAWARNRESYRAKERRGENERRSSRT